MAKIEEELRLVDKFTSGFDAFIKGCQESTKAVEQTRAVIDNISAATEPIAARAVETAARMATQAAEEINQETTAVEDLATAVQRLQEKWDAIEPVKSVSGIKNMTDQQTELFREMEQAGLKWEKSLAHYEKTALMATSTIQELIDRGMLRFAKTVEDTTQEEETAAQETTKFERVMRAFGTAVGSTAGKVRDFITDLWQAGEAEEDAAEKVGWFERSLVEMGEKSPIEAMVKQVSKMALSFFTVRKLVRYISDAMKRAPAEIAAPFDRLKSTVGDNFAQIVVSSMALATQGVEKLNAAFESEAGKNFFNGIYSIAIVVGQVFSFATEVLAKFVSFVGNNLEPIMMTAALVLAYFSRQMIVAAAQTALTAAPFLLLVSAVGGLLIILNKVGITFPKIIGGISYGIGWLSGAVDNMCSGIWNGVAWLLETVINGARNAFETIKGWISGTFNFFMDMVSAASQLFDKLFGTNTADIVEKMRSTISKAFATDPLGNIAIKRAEYVDLNERGEAAREKTQKFLDDLGAKIKDVVSLPLKDIDENVDSISRAVSATDEDIRSLVDLAERRYITQVNLTAQTPVINVTGQNTGNTERDRESLAAAIAQVLIEQSAAGATRETEAAI